MGQAKSQQTLVDPNFDERRAGGRKTIAAAVQKLDAAAAGLPAIDE